jgi:hypothetical protein
VVLYIYILCGYIVRLRESQGGGGGLLIVKLISTCLRSAYIHTYSFLLCWPKVPNQTLSNLGGLDHQLVKMIINWLKFDVLSRIKKLTIRCEIYSKIKIFCYL